MTGTGTDIVAIDRIAALLADHGERFLERCFRPDEVMVADGAGLPDASVVAAAWAGKEALLKALSVSIAAHPYRDIEILRTPDGAASVRLHGVARQTWLDHGGGAIHVALAHDRDYALAFVVIE